MSGWASLSGYLFIKAGGGGLNILKPKKRVWCVLEESQGKLLYFKSEEDARSKPPMGYVELCGAAITLDMDTPNQFVVIVESRETLLTAENHESMMIWLMALQARRDQFARANKSPNQDNTDDLDSTFDPEDNPDWALEAMGSRERSVSELSVFTQLQQQRQHKLQHQTLLQNHRALEGTKSFGMQGAGSTVSYLGHSPTWRRNQLRRMGETTDGNHPPLKNSTLSLLQPGSKQQSVSMEMTDVIHYLSPPPLTTITNNKGLNNSTPTTPPTPNTPNSTTGSFQHQYHHHNSIVNNNNLNYNHINGNGGNGGSGGVSPYLNNWSSSASISTDNTGDDVTNTSFLEPGGVPGGGGTNSHRLLGRSVSAREGGTGGIHPISEHSSLNGSVSDSDNRLSSLEQELITTKCELARVMNRQTCFQEILKQKDEIIEDMDEKLGNKNTGGDGYDSKKRQTSSSSSSSKGNQERVRVLQNQNRFLNEEVRRLAKLRQNEHVQIQSIDSQVKSLEADIEVWKLEYISLIQSSIRFTGTDTMDDAELSLFGGDRHKHRILSLLEDARKINPSLPTYEYLSSGEVHVDTYGFKHQFIDDGLLLHYLCIELSQHFLSQASSFEKHQKQWSLYLKHNAKNVLTDRKELKKLVRGGIPEPFRKLMWKSFVMAKVSDVLQEKGVHYYRHLCNAVPDSPQAARYRKQISLDLMRTMPSNVKFSTPGSKGIMDLQDVLLAFCIHNPDVGYCQGMNFLVAMALLFMDAQDAFWTLVAVTECFHSPSYFDHNLLGAQADQTVLHDLMEEKLPNLTRHLDAIEIEISTVTLNWFLALFFDAVPFQTLLRVWDCFLLEGPKVLFRFSLAILHSHSKEIMRKTDTISVMRHLKACARISYDIDGLVQTAFRTLKPFPRRHDIVSKQTFYLNGLKEKYRWREMQRVAFSERDGLLADGEGDMVVREGIFECCTVSSSGQSWVAYGCSTGTKVCIVDMVDQTMTDTNIQIDSRVICMSSIEDECVFMGTLSSVVYAWNQDTRVMAWHQRVHDAVLSLQVFHDPEGESPPRLFAALADGTVAVFDGVSLTCKVNDLLYLPIGQSPVSCLQLLSNQLWCACGNTVSVIQASTLDPMDQFNVSSNPYDTILSMIPGIPGVWISVRGSSVLELWDPSSLSCKMLYDTCSGKAPTLKKDDDNNFNPARITSILALDHSVWVGTGEGTLYTFDVFTQNGVTSETSPFFTDSLVGLDADCGLSLKSSSEKDSDSLKQDSYARIMEVEKRVKDLYLQRLVGQGFLGKRKKKKDEDDIDDDCVEDDDNDTETEERRCLILEKEERESRRMKRKGGKDEDRRRGVESSKTKRKSMREKLSSVDILPGKNKNSKNGSDSKNSKVHTNGVTNSNESSNYKSETNKIDKCLVNDSGFDSSVLRTSIDIVSDGEHEKIEMTISSNSSMLNNKKTTNSRTSSTSSTHFLDKTIREEEGEEELLNETLLESETNGDNSFTNKKTITAPPDYPTVYYLFRPEPEEEGRSSSANTITNNSDEALHKCRDIHQSQSSRAKGRGISPSSPRDVTKSEDSGIFCSTEKNAEASDEIATADEIPQTKHKLSLHSVSINGSFGEDENVKGGEIESSGDGKTHGSIQGTGKSLECCVNASSQFYNEEKDVQSQGINGEVSHGSIIKTSASLESTKRSISEESNKTAGSDDVFCEDIQNLNNNEVENGVDEEEEKQNISVNAIVNKPNKKNRLSKLSCQLEFDEKLEKSNENVNELSKHEQCNGEQTITHKNNKEDNSTNPEVRYENGIEENKNSTTIEITNSPVSNHDRHSTKKACLVKSLPNSFSQHFTEVKINQIAEILSNPDHNPKTEPSNCATNGINHNTSSSEEEDSFGDFIGSPKHDKVGTFFNEHFSFDSASCENGVGGNKNSSSHSEKDIEKVSLSQETESFPEKMVDENVSDQQSESAYSTSTDSFHSDLESDLVESLSSSSNVKSIAAKFEHQIVLEEKSKSCQSEKQQSWKNSGVPKCGTKLTKDRNSSNPEDESVFQNSKSAIKCAQCSPSPTQKTHQKLCRLSSSGQSENLAHEMGSSASSCDNLTSHNTRSNNRSSKSHHHNKNTPSVQTQSHPKKILTTTNSGKIKLAKRSSSKRILLSSEKNKESVNENKEIGDKIDTKYYGDSDEDKKVHEARVKSFKDTYRRLSVTNNNPQKNQLKSENVLTSGGKSQTEITNHISRSNSQEKPQYFPPSYSEATKLPSYATTNTFSQNSNKANNNNCNNHTSTLPNSSTPSQSLCDCDKLSTTTTNNNTNPNNNKSSITSATQPTVNPKQTQQHNNHQHHPLCRMNSVDSSSILDDDSNVPPRDAGARWRLDYTNIHVDTDMESLAFSFDGDSVSPQDMESALLRRRLSSLSVTADSHEQRMNQFLRDTASTFEEHYRHALDDEKTTFMHTPTLSRSNSVCWSSYDEISTPSQCEGDTTGLPGGQNHCKFPRSTTYSLASRSTSVASTVEVQFSVDMSLLSKNKISDKPVKWLLRTEMRGKPTVLSLAGAHNDDEAVLVWIREANETLWTNCPVYAYNPKTKTATLPSYMKQISTSSSSKSSPRQRLASFNSN